MFRLLLASLFALGAACPSAQRPSGIDKDVPSVWVEQAQGKKPSRSQTQQLFIGDMQRLSLENASIPAHQVGDGTLRVATYNVHFWTDPFGRTNFNQILQTIGALNADVLVLQEVVWGANANNGNRSADQLENEFRKLGFQFGGGSEKTFCKASDHGGPFGNIIFSRIDFVESGVHSYFENRGDPRCYSYAVYNLPKGEQLAVYGTHFEVSQEEYRVNQAEELFAFIASKGQKNVLVTGDFNAVSQRHYQYQVLGKNVWDLVLADDKSRNELTKTDLIDYIENTALFADAFVKAKLPLPKTTVWSGRVVDYFYLSPSFGLPVAGARVFYGSASDHMPVLMDIAM